MPRDWSGPKFYLGSEDPLPDSAADELRAVMPSPAEPSDTQPTELTEAEAAAFLGMSPETLARHRRAGTGPEYFSRRAKRDAAFAAAGWLRGVDPASVPADPYEAARWAGGGRRVDLGGLRYRREALELWAAVMVPSVMRPQRLLRERSHCI